ncbi:MAG: hypothetical protein ACRD12_20145 [Acidimicrobiales bacterium]
MDSNHALRAGLWVSLVLLLVAGAVGLAFRPMTPQVRVPRAVPAAAFAGNDGGPVITPDQAQEVVRAVWPVRQQALREGDTGLLEKLETGSALAGDRQAARVGGLRHQFADTGTVRVSVPRQDAYPARFLAEVRIEPDGPYVELMVFVRTDPSEPWKIALDSGFDPRILEGAMWPDPAVDPDGFNVVGVNDGVDPARPHAELARYWQGWVDEGTPPAGAPFAAGAWTTSLGAALHERNPQGGLAANGLLGRSAFDAQPSEGVFTFGLAGGGMLSCSTVRQLSTFSSPKPNIRTRQDA